jgi:hypothetical protein
MKEHLAGVQGQVTPCPSVDLDIRQKMLDSIEEYQSRKGQAKRD